MFMNRTKRNLILASAIVNLLQVTLSLVMSILVALEVPGVAQYLQYSFILTYSPSLVYAIIAMIVGTISSILLIFSVRSKGKYFRTCRGMYIAGFIMIVVFGGFLAWLLLFISCFIPDIIVMNTPREVRQEERAEEREYEQKRKKIEDLKKLRDGGIITEEEYRDKLYELL